MWKQNKLSACTHTHKKRTKKEKFRCYLFNKLLLAFFWANALIIEGRNLALCNGTIQIEHIKPIQMPCP